MYLREVLQIRQIWTSLDTICFLMIVNFDKVQELGNILYWVYPCHGFYINLTITFDHRTKLTFFSSDTMDDSTGLTSSHFGPFVYRSDDFGVGYLSHLSDDSDLIGFSHHFAIC